MSLTLTTTPRTTIGKGLRSVRDAGFVPAIMYARGLEPQALQLKLSEFQKVYRQAGFSALVDVVVGTGAPVKALIQEVQVHPLTSSPEHVDFRQIRMDEELTVDVPLVFKGESPAVKELAGTLVHALDSLSVTCLPANLPHEITVELSSLKTFDDVVTVGSLTLPAGVRVSDDAETVLASVAPPLTEDQLKKMEEESAGDVTAIKTEAEEKKAKADAEKAEEEKAKEAAA